ncbi:IS66 family insertion sequence element accessory protein TnpB [Inquilinus limosus]|uniref:IS66 family insertion sequence element accessory protein TnpB n=1 Tax=Inquilinus limosus TaxID=171674 RepID=UPI003F5CF668
MSAAVRQTCGAASTAWPPRQDPYSGHLFLFRSRKADYLKILHYDGTGLCLLPRGWKGKFVWPPIVDGTMVLAPAQMALLVEAMDWRRTVAPEPPRRPAVI